MNLLIVHEVDYLSKIIYEFQILPEILSMQGHQVTIVDYDDAWSEKRPSRRVVLRTEVHEDVHRAYPDASVTVRRPGMIRMPVVSRISGAITSGLEVARLLRYTSVDAIILYGLPTVGLQVWTAARLYDVPLFFRSIDVLHRLVPHPVLVRPTKLLERFIYGKVRAITCVTPHLKKYVESYGVPEARVDVLPSGVDRQMFSPGSPNPDIMARWNLEPSHRAILFMGTVYTFSGLDRVIRDLPVLLARHPTARLLVAGEGEDTDRLKALCRQSGVEDEVVFTGLLPYSDLPDLIRSCEVCINPFELNSVTRDILPTKLFQYLSCGKPVVATELPGTIPFLSGEEHGLVVARLENFVETLACLLDEPDRIRRLGRNGTSVTGEKYDWERIARRLVAWIRERSG